MDKTAIKNYAVSARRRLMDAVRTKMASLYIYEEGADPPGVAEAKLQADGVFLTPQQKSARLKLCGYLARLEDDLDREKAFIHVLEEVAYTWFNRLIALRYMEVNEYLPSGIRILSSVEPGRTEPDAVREAERLDYVDQNKIAQLRSDTSPGALERLYQYILISQCNALHDILPGMFQKIDDYTELLLPDSLNSQGGIVHDLVHSIDEEDFRDQVQIIGWLYQYYISEKKDEVFARPKSEKLNKETIPAATQLFTPEWIVKYMVENSLGRLWLERHPSPELRESWKYYVDEAEQEPEVAAQLKALVEQSPINSPQDIRLIDPCMGSGHILVYAFDVLHQIYVSCGYAQREIPGLILRHNLYGLDIDGRAAQLAYFALMMKARSYNRRLFRPRDGGDIPQPQVYDFVETDGVRQHHLDAMGDGMDEALRSRCIEGLGYLMELFADAREYGSILKIEKELDYDALHRFVTAIRPGQSSMEEGDLSHVQEVLLGIVNAARLLAQRYDVAVTNPPYMSPTPGQAEYVKKNYPDSKADLFAVFIERCGELLKANGYQAMITMHSWMFLSSYERLRVKLLRTRTIINMAHLGARAFEEIGGEVVQTTAFVLHGRTPQYKANYYRLISYGSHLEKEKEFVSRNNCYTENQEEFIRIPSNPICYWIAHQAINAFEQPTIRDVAFPCIGMRTGENAQFLRFWHEIEKDNFMVNAHSAEEAMSSHRKWFPYNKGGEYRKWYGNNDIVVNWENDGEDIKAETRRKYPGLGDNLSWKISNEQFFFQESLTWTFVGSNSFGIRYSKAGALFDVGGSSVFPKTVSFEYLLGYLVSNVALYYLDAMNPTLNIQVANIARLPIYLPERHNDEITSLVRENIYISRTDWDSFETSWDFQTHPFLTHKGATLAESFASWEAFADAQFAQLKANEEELNHIFIDIYGLQDELTPEVEDKDVTVRRACLPRDVRSFVSYAVGCMFGRYSLDEPGLVFAGGAFDLSRYKAFPPEEDNLLPIGSDDYFDDDIVVRFAEFLRAAYGDSTLDENLGFIADALYPNGSGSPKEKIRRYFLNDFYRDHLKIYKKRPIYWLLDSAGGQRGKDGFKALFYLHRYDKYTVARARTDYLHPLQRKYESEISRLALLSDSTENARERADYRKKIETLQARLDECHAYDDVVAHLANQYIQLDLDDGVKVNYAKFQGVEVPMDNGKRVKMDLLGKI